MIGERLAQVRKDNDEKQTELAEFLKVSVHSVRSWEQEKSSPSHEMLVAICNHYKVTSDYLLGLSNDRPVYGKIKNPGDCSGRHISFLCGSIIAENWVFFKTCSYFSLRYNIRTRGNA